jgi:hypothetical protein
MHASADDISSTKEAMRALSTIGIPVLDHLIIAGTRGISMRLNGYIPEEEWLHQQPDGKMLAAWTLLIED